jgi:hypothetical protein
LAEAAEEITRLLPGLIDEPDVFTIERYEVDKDHGRGVSSATEALLQCPRFSPR